MGWGGSGVVCGAVRWVAVWVFVGNLMMYVCDYGWCEEWLNTGGKILTL